MGDGTIIAWTNATFNIAWGCTKVSPGCAHCYAETGSSRYGHTVWGPDAARRTFGEAHWKEPLKWNRQAKEAKKRMRVFCSSMCDIFEDHPTIEAERAKLWPLIQQTPWLDWQLLTKRIERVKDNLPVDWGDGYPNVWMGTSVENQYFADIRIPILLEIPAAVHFISYEPALGPVDFLPLIGYYSPHEIRGTSRQDMPCRCSGGRIDYRQTRSHLENSEARLGSMEQAHPSKQMQKGKSRTQTERVSFNTSDGERQEMDNWRTSPGLPLLDRADTERLHDQSREWDQERQSPTESNTGDIFRAGDSRTEDSKSRANEPIRRTERDAQIDRQAGSTDSQPARLGRETCKYCGGFRDFISSCLENSPWGQVAKSIWLIQGGESGPGYRPMDPQWARDVRDQCKKVGIPYFFKQSAAPRTEMGIKLDGKIIRQYPEPRKTNGGPKANTLF